MTSDVLKAWESCDLTDTVCLLGVEISDESLFQLYFRRELQFL